MVEDNLELIRLSNIEEIPYWKDLTDDAIVDEVKDILIRFCIYFQQLAVEYDQLDQIGKWDPDENYTPCEYQIYALARFFGLHYTSLGNEARRRFQAWETHCNEVREQVEGNE